jgi:hypothetical protein
MRIKSIALVLCCLAFGGRMASACDTFRNTEPAVQFNHWCSGNFIIFFWDAYDFDKGDWDDGFGFSDPCDLRRPLARTFQAIEMVNFSAPVDPMLTNDFSGDILHWGGNYTIREIDELDGRCSNDPFHAFTVWGAFIDNNTELYTKFFYSDDVVTRASLLVHEARHADWCGHNGNDGSNACPAGSASCDEKFNDGCSGIGSPTGKGADAFQVMWLWVFTSEADAQHGGAVRKAMARDAANSLLNSMFDVDPCFNIMSNGDKITTC